MEVMNVPQSRSRISIRPSMINTKQFKKGGKVFEDILGKVGSAFAPGLMDLATDYAKKKLSGGMAIPLKISVAQKRTLKKGGAITIKPDMISEVSKEALALLPASAKKILSALSKNKGIRYALKQGETLVDRMTGKGLFEDFFTKTIPSLGKDLAKPYEALGVNPFELGYELGHDVIAPALLGKGVRKGRGRAKRGKGNAFTDFFTKTIPSAVKSIPSVVMSKVDEYKENPQNAYADFLDSGTASAKNPFTGKSLEGEVYRRGESGSGLKHSVGVRNGSAYAKVGGMMCGGSFLPAGGSIYTAGKRGGMMGCGVDMPIQLGGPYIKANSPAMTPFIVTRSIQSSNLIR